MLLSELTDSHARLTTLMNKERVLEVPLTLAAVDEAAGALWIGTRRRIGLEALRSELTDVIGDLPVALHRLRFFRHGKQQKVRPISGALKIVYPEGGALGVGTIGVIAERDSVLGFVTAGHVVDRVGTKIYQPSNSPSNGVGTTKVVSDWKGTAVSDSAFVEAQFGSRNKPVKGTIWKDDTSNYQVSETGTAAVGQTVIMSGQTNNTGTESGQVLTIGATVSFEDAGTLSDQTITNYLTNQGDSGGPVFQVVSGNNVRLLGINVGASGKDDIDPKPEKLPNSKNGLYGVYSLWSSVVGDLGDLSVT